MPAPEIIPFKTIGTTTLHMHVFRPDASGTDRRPAVVFFFCGGWNGFNATKLYPQSEYLASRGMVCLNAEVRVRQHGTTPAECVTDGKSALRWARANAARLGLDPARLAAGGGSASGHVCASLATIDGFDDPADDRTISCVPDACSFSIPAWTSPPPSGGSASSAASSAPTPFRPWSMLNPVCRPRS
ncbi:MAG: alpha/beta hydrolase [Planctomycetota bacterium]